MNAESAHNFIGGQNTDFNHLLQPGGTYRLAQNFTRDRSGRLINETGTAILDTLPTDLQIIGSTVLDTRIIFFLCSSDNTQNEIGFISTITNAYSTVINAPVLNFRIDKQVDAIARINFNHEAIVYFVDNLNPPRKLNIDSPPATADYASVTKLMRDLKMPTFTLTGMIESGNLKCGTYQFALRYVDENGNKTAFSLWTKPIPVVNENRSVGRQQFDGGSLTTTAAKTIVLQIDDLDILFPFIEIGVFFLNDSAQETYRIVEQRSINATTTILAFSELPDEEDNEIDFTEAVVEFPTIETAKCIEQKDSRCFISNIVEPSEESLQIIANNIEVEYVIKEVDFYNDNGATTNRYLDYKGEDVCVDFRGYQRDEIYSLSIGVIYNTGKLSFSTHIPARLGVGTTTVDYDSVTKELTDPLNTNRTWVRATVDTATTGQLGTYVSINTYPPGQGYPEDGIVTPGAPGEPDLYHIRHHKMPSLEQQPSFEYGGAKIRIIGLKFKLNATAQAQLALLGDRIQGIYFGREARNKPQNKSIFAQGLTKNLFKTYNSYTFSDGDITGDAVYKKEPLFGNYKIDTDEDNTVFGIRRTIAFYPTSSTSLAVDAPFESTNPAQVDFDKVAFFAPEPALDIYQIAEFNTDITGTERLNLYPSHLKTVLKLQGDITTSRLTGMEYQDNRTLGTGSVFLDLSPQIWRLSDYVRNYALTGGEIQRISIDKAKSDFISNGEVADIGESIDLDNGRSGEFMYLKLDSSLTKPSSAITSLFYKVNLATASVSNNYINYPTTDTKLLCNLINERIDQYENVGNKEYNIIKIFKDFSTDEYECYGGDTFICKYAFRDQDVYSMKGLKGHFVSGVLDTTNWTPADDYNVPDAIDIDSKEGFSFKDMSYYFVESFLNVGYQHEEPGINTYYPNSSLVDEFQKPYTKENNKSYNKTYSSDKEIKGSFSKPIDFTSVGKFETRTYYSNQSVQGEKFDAFTEFRANNYDDLPKHTGEIWDSFVLDDTLYMHTPQSLWRTFVNPKSAIMSDIGEVYFGTGTIFSQPAEQLFTITGGYVGTTSQWAGCNTPFGRFFVDNRQGKVFLFTGSKFEEISDHGMFRDFLAKIQDLPDAPANASGYISAYDFKSKRWILTRVGAEASFTLSYHPELKSWTSYHTYRPNHLVSSGNRLFMFRNSTYALYEANEGPKGVYFDDGPADSVISIVVSTGGGSANGQPFTAGQDDTKVFDNMEFHTIARNPAGVAQLFDTFDRIQCINEYQDTGEIEIITSNTNYIDETLVLTQLLARMKNNHFRIALPRDNGGDERRLKSQWLEITLKYQNTDNNEFVVSTIKTRFRYVFR